MATIKQISAETWAKIIAFFKEKVLPILLKWWQDRQAKQ